MLMVLEIAPEMKGCAAAIMRMWLSTERNRRPVRPHGSMSPSGAVLRGRRRRCALKAGVAAKRPYRDGFLA
jgi:hypothetical protein